MKTTFFKRRFGPTLLLCASALVLLGRLASLVESEAQNRPENIDPRLTVQIGTPDSIMSVRFNPDGKTLASVGVLSKIVKLWDIATGRELKTFEASSSVCSIAFSPDGTTLAVGTSNTTTSLDGRTLFYGEGEPTLILWDVATGSVSVTIKGYHLCPESLAFSSDGKLLVSGNSVEIRSWAVYEGRDLGDLRGPDWDVSSINLSPEWKIWVSGSEENDVKFWDVFSDKEPLTLKGHTGRVSTVVLSFDGKTLASGSRDNTIKLWDIAGARLLKTLKGHTDGVEVVTFSNDGKTLVSGSRDNTLRLWDVDSGKTLKIFKGHSDSVLSVSFSYDGKTLASGSRDSTLRFWDVDTGREIRTIKGYFSAVVSAAFSPDGKFLMSGNEDKTVSLWDTATWRHLKTIKVDSPFVDTLAISPNGNILAYGEGEVDGDFGEIKIWDIAAGRYRKTLKGHSRVVSSVAFSPDGKILASGSWDGTVKLWNFDTGAELRTLEGHSTYVVSLAFSPDGKTLASGGLDKVVKLWDVGSGENIKYDKLPEWRGRVTPSIIAAPGDRLVRVVEGTNFIVLQDRTDQNNIKDIATLVTFKDKDNEWAVITPNGRFDTNKDLGGEIEGLGWILPEDPFIPLPLELFMREYYEPNLLWRVVNQEKLPAIRDLSKLNIAQPSVKITNVSLPDANNEVSVTVKVENGSREVTRGGKRATQVSGAYDLHLFRDGRLVKSAPEDSDAELAKIPTGYGLEEEIPLWRNATRILSPEENPKTLTFKVKLPKSKDASKVSFTAYAFNEDRVKSDTARWEWTPDQISKLPKAQSVKSKVYLISVGVNETGNPRWTLKYAGEDARQMQKVLGDKLAEQQRFDVIRFWLTSEKLGDTSAYQANKENIKAVFDILAGRKIEENVLQSIPDIKRIQKSTPDDIIIMTFSSHGLTDSNGSFYIIQSGVRYDSKGIITSSLISSEEIGRWMKDLEADKMFMIIDACYSAEIVGKDFKPGPMGSRGLGQLAYNKEIRILTAAKDQAYETSRLGMSVLSYVLLKKGIENGEANFKPAEDNTITFREWMEYAEKEVPALYGDSEGAGGSAQGSASKNAKDYLQRPYLFDFVRDMSDLEITRILNK